MSNLSKTFFWTKQVRKIIWEPFWWIIVIAIVVWIPFLRPWWWIFAPLFLAIELKTLYKWWMNWDYGYSKTKWVMLEIIPPKEVLVPLKAMEDVFATMWGPLIDHPSWREIFCTGSLDYYTDWMSWEIVSIEGQLHFYVRVTAGHRPSLETTLYGHYPELEIHEVDDYTKNVPHNMPNEEWDVYGEDFILGTDQVYPIKTYEKFFEPQGKLGCNLLFHLPTKKMTRSFINKENPLLQRLQNVQKRKKGPCGGMLLMFCITLSWGLKKKDPAIK